MNEIGRLIKKGQSVVKSRGFNGFWIAWKSYIYKNLSILSFGTEKSGDVLVIGDCDINDLKDSGFIYKQIYDNKFNKKYLKLYDVFYFGDDVLIDGEIKNKIQKYNKLYIDKAILGENKLLDYIQKNRKKKIIYVSSSTNISGGVMVIAQHLQQLQDLGYNTLLVTQDVNVDMSWKEDFDMPILHIGQINKECYGNDVVVATFWDTVQFVRNIKSKNKYYLVQNKEHLFYKISNPFYQKAKNTYLDNNLKFLTVSKWCQKWLEKEFNKKAKYIPNCIDINLFNKDVKPLKAKKNNKFRILIEGNPENDYKNVDEAFKITDSLDENNFEVWLVSYGGKPKKWYKYNRLFQKIPYFEMPAIYGSCDILLKTSKLESFSYPPLEMMACGGLCVVAGNEGNREYLNDNYNALVYKLGDINMAIKYINELNNDSNLRNKLVMGGVETVKNRNLKRLKNELKNIF